MEPIWSGNEIVDSYQDAHLRIDYRTRCVSVDGRPLTLTPKEYALLTLLAAHAGEAIPRKTMLLAVWGYGDGIRTRTLDVHIARLRRKLGAGRHQYLETIFGAGCRFSPLRERQETFSLANFRQPLAAAGV